MEHRRLGESGVRVWAITLGRRTSRIDNFPAEPEAER